MMDACMWRVHVVSLGPVDLNQGITAGSGASTDLSDLQIVSIQWNPSNVRKDLKDNRPVIVLFQSGY